MGAPSRLSRRTDAGHRPEDQDLQRTVYLLYAHDTRDGRQHVLNVFTDQATARAQCTEWQARHRRWYDGLNPFHLFLRRAALNKPGRDALEAQDERVVDADWD